MVVKRTQEFGIWVGETARSTALVKSQAHERLVVSRSRISTKLN
jgi:hypothetical protein